MMKDFLEGMSSKVTVSLVDEEKQQEIQVEDYVWRSVKKP